MITNKVEICGVNTSKLPVLSGKEKEELLIKIKQGDEDARNKFIVGNLRLVLSVIQKFNSRGENADDLFQVGCVGLMKAIKNFDLSVGVKFSTYAVPMIIGEIRRYLRDYNSIRVSRSLKDIAYKALQAKEAILRESGAEPTIEQIAQKMELEPKQVTTALDAIQDPISLYEPVFSDGTDTLFVMDQVSDKKSLDENWIEEISLREAYTDGSSRRNRYLTGSGFTP